MPLLLFWGEGAAATAAAHDAQVLHQVSHLQSGHSGLEALVPLLDPPPLYGLFQVISGHYTEYHRHTSIQ